MADDRPRIDVRIPAALLPEEVRELALPELVPVRRSQPDPRIDDPRGAVREALGAKLDADGASDLHGKRVALCLGSRGLGRYAELVAGAKDALRARGATPILVPAMGSHGGGTPEGQTSVLHDYGLVDEDDEVVADDATRQVGRLSDGMPVHASEVALSCDRIVILNRVKSHTGFRGPVESGLAKMMVIGLGKRPGAAVIHRLGYAHFAERLVAARDLLVGVYPNPTFVGVVEDAQGRPDHVEALLGREIVEREPELLKMAKARMARLPFAKLDVLVVERAGKDISGLGMDPNVTGRHASGEHEPPDPTRIALLSLTEASEGNANGMGHADVIPLAFARAIDPVPTWTNAMTSTSLPSARLPVVVPDAASAVRLALATCGANPADARIAWIRDTGHLDRFLASRTALDTLGESAAELEELGPPGPVPLDVV